MLSLENGPWNQQLYVYRLDRTIVYLIGRYLNLGTWEHLIIFESVFVFVGNFCAAPVYM